MTQVEIEAFELEPKLSYQANYHYSYRLISQKKGQTVYTFYGMMSSLWPSILANSPSHFIPLLISNESVAP